MINIVVLIFSITVILLSQLTQHDVLRQKILDSNLEVCHPVVSVQH